MQGKRGGQIQRGQTFVEELGARPLRTRWKSTLARTSRAKDRALYLTGESSAPEVAECLICERLNESWHWEKPR